MRSTYKHATTMNQMSTLLWNGDSSGSPLPTGHRKVPLYTHIFKDGLISKVPLLIVGGQPENISETGLSYVFLQR